MTTMRQLLLPRWILTTAYINRIATAVPPHDMHAAFVLFAESLLPEGTPKNLYRRMARMSAIDHRYSFLKPVVTEDGSLQDASALLCSRPFFRPRRAACKPLKNSRRNWRTVHSRSCTHRARASGCHARHRYLLHGPLRSRPRFEIVESLHLNPSVERNFHRLYGLLCRHQRAQSIAPHHPLRA